VKYPSAKNLAILKKKNMRHGFSDSLVSGESICGSLNIHCAGNFRKK
jgi:hypothetical protein